MGSCKKILGILAVAGVFFLMGSINQPAIAAYPVSVSSGNGSAYHTVILKGDGTVWAWGWNHYGQLGDNTIIARRTPVQVLGSGGSGVLSNIIALAGGDYHTVALKSDGTVWAWGYNWYGQLGDDSTTDRHTPVLSLIAVPYAQVTDLWPVTGARHGQASELWAKVENTGHTVLPSGAAVWFFVSGPGWSGSHWVGSDSVSGLAPGDPAAWYSYSWAIPSGAEAGRYAYWAQVWSGSAISLFRGPEVFDVDCTSALVVAVWPVDNAHFGQVSRLWAEVKNTGTVAMCTDVKVRFWVDGPGWSGSHWVGSASVAGLAPNTPTWYSYDWMIPAWAVGSYTYWAQVFAGKSAISPWSSGEVFTVSCP